MNELYLVLANIMFLPPKGPETENSFSDQENKEKSASKCMA